MSLITNGSDTISALEDADHTYSRDGFSKETQQDGRALVLSNRNGWGVTVSAVQDWDIRKQTWKPHRYVFARWEKEGADWHLHTVMRLARDEYHALIRDGAALPGYEHEEER